MVNPLAGRDPGQDPGDLVLLLTRRAEQGDVPADGLCLRVTIDPLGGRVPARDRAVQRFADDRVIGGLNDRRQLSELAPPRTCAR